MAEFRMQAGPLLASLDAGRVTPALLAATSGTDSAIAPGTPPGKTPVDAGGAKSAARGASL
jgi:hypothetical protein